jgi:hypothetical protein
MTAKKKTSNLFDPINIQKALLVPSTCGEQGVNENNN